MASNAATAASNALNLYGGPSAVSNAQSAASASALTATAQAALAATYAASAASVAQQDLSGVTAGALHRSPNAIVSQYIYDTSRDSDGGTWVDKSTWQSWSNESLNGPWIYSSLQNFMGFGAGSTSGSQNAILPELVARSAGASLGPNLLSGNWSSFSGGTVSGTATDFTVTSTGYAGAQLALTVEANVTYLITGRVTGANAGRIYGNATASLTSPWVNVASLNGGFAFVVTPTGTSLTLMAGCGTSGQTVSFAGMQVQKVVTWAPSGAYYQSSTDGKFYRLWSNRFGSSEDFTNAVWTRNHLAAVNSKADGIGDFLVENTENTSHYLNQSATLIGGQGTAVVRAKAGTRSVMAINVGGNAAAYFNLSAGTVGTVSAGCTASIAPVTGLAGYYDCTFTNPNPSGTVAQIFVCQADAVASYVGDGVSGIYVARAQLNTGTAQAYETKASTDQGTTEVFRGNTAKFPRIAGIVAEASNITIYDLLTPGRPMWMRFAALSSSTKSEYLPSTATITGVTMVNGRMSYSGSGGNVYLSSADFILDRGWRYNTSGFGWRFDVIAHRQVVPATAWLDSSVVGIPSLTCNAVASTVLPDAPVDPATGLQVPTTAVATSGGVGIAQNNGTVVSSGNTASFTKLALSPWVLVATNGSGYNYLAVTPGTLGSGWTFTSTTAASTAGSPSTGQGLGTVSTNGRANVGFAAAGVGYPGHFSYLVGNTSNTAASLTSQIDAYSNTGWMVGDLRRCYLSSNQVGATVAGNNIITDSTFDNAGTVSLYGIQDANISRTVSGGVLTTTTNTSAGSDFVYYTAATEPGVQYTVTASCAVVATAYGGWFDVRDGASGGTLILNTSSGNYSPGTAATGTITTTFTAQTATTSIRLRMYKMQNDASITWDNFSCNVVGLADRSAKLQPIALNGTLTKTSAGGLSMFSGWSASNYLQQPYSADLDFGTGPWRISSWLNIPIAGCAPANFFTNSEFQTGLSGVSYTSLVSTCVFSGVANNTGIAIGYDGTNSQYAYKNGFTAVASTPYTITALVTMDDGAGPPVFGGGTNATTSANDFALVIGNTPSTPSSVVVTDLGGGLYRVQASITSFTSGLSNNGVCKYNTNSSRTFKTSGWQVERGAFSGYHQTGSTTYNSIAPILDRSAATGSYIKAGVDGNGNLAVEVFDGTTTRRATSATGYNYGANIKASFEYTTDGTLRVGVNGNSVGTATGAPLASLSNASALLTIGNARTLDTAFPASSALLKIGATVPTQEQKTFMFLQEQAIFQSGNACTLPDSTSVLDLDYDAVAEKWKVISASNESTFQGLARVATAALPTGAFTKASHKSGIKLLARNSTNPGVDVTVPAQSLMAELANRDRAAAEKARLEEVYDYVGGFTATTTTAAGSATVLSSVSGVTPAQNFVGAVFTGSGISANTYITGYSASAFSISAPATLAASGVAMSFTDFVLPVGYEAKSVMVNGVMKQEGTTKDWTRLFDGFRETIRFAVAPGATAWVQIKARRTK
jgi:hypothetical protein